MADQPPDPEVESAQLRSQSEAADARWAGVVTGLVGTITILLIAMLVDTTKNQLLAAAVLVSSGFGLFWLPIGLLSGWFAHKYFAGTDFPPSFIAVILSSIGILSTLGWAFVMMLRV